MTKIYKKLTAGQKKRGVIFSSQLSYTRSGSEMNTIHEVFANESDRDKAKEIRLLKQDDFFNNSQWKYNIIRQ